MTEQDKEKAWMKTFEGMSDMDVIKYKEIGRTRFYDGFDAGYEHAMKQNEKLIEALKFYADVNNWESYLGVKGQIDDDDLSFVEIIVDGEDCSDDVGGHRARQALKEYEEQYEQK